MMASAGATGPGQVRADVWLCAARFFKTRSLAKQALAAGKVEVNGQGCKPARSVVMGDRLRIARGDELWTVEVTGLSERRGSATVASTLFCELEESRAAREAAREQRRMAGAGDGHPRRRPDRRARSAIRGFKDSL